MMGVSSKQAAHWPPSTAWYMVGESSKEVMVKPYSSFRLSA